MSKFFEFDKGEWDALVDKFNPSYIKQRTDMFLEKEIKGLGEFVRSGSAEKTPVGSYSPQVDYTTRKGINISFTANDYPMGGHLRKSWRTTRPKKEGKSYTIDVVNNASVFNTPKHPLAKNTGVYFYAEDVEFGHIATTLDRIPDQTAAGIVRPVKQTPVAGQYMLTDTLDEIETVYNPILANRYREMLKSLMEDD